MEFAARLKSLRQAKQWSQADLVAASTLSAPTISRYERVSGDPRISWKNIQRLADALDVDERYLQGRRPDLDLLPFEVVAAHESLRKFLATSNERPKDAARYARLAQNPVAPKSTEGWKNFVILLKLFLGRDLPTKAKARVSRVSEGRPTPLVVRPFRGRG
jgi:transcriptional regulator with XRE-family HTH domain